MASISTQASDGKADGVATNVKHPEAQVCCTWMASPLSIQIMVEKTQFIARRVLIAKFFGCLTHHWAVGTSIYLLKD